MPRRRDRDATRRRSPWTLCPPGSRGRGWYVRFSLGPGRRYEIALAAQDRAGAELEAAQRWAALRGAADAGSAAAAPVSFRAAADSYLAATPRLGRQDRGYIAALQAHLGARPVDRITHADIVEAARILKPRGSAANVNRAVINPASAVLHYAHEQNWCADPQLRRMWVSRKSPRRPAADSTIAALLAGLDRIEAALQIELAGRRRPADARPIARQMAGFRRAACRRELDGLPYRRALLAMLYETGLRISDLLHLVDDRLDLPAGKAVVDIRKTDERLAVHLSPAIVAMLANLPRQPGGRVFPWRHRQGVYRWLRPLAAACGVTYTPHQSRHRLATDLLAAKIPDKEAADYGAWRDPRSLQRYQHVAPRPLEGRTVTDLVSRVGETRGKSNAKA